MKRLLKWALAGLVLLVVLIVIIVIATGGGSGMTTTAPIAAAPVAETATAPVVGTSIAPIAGTTTVATKPPAWHEVYKLSGSASKQSDTFALSGAPARLRYSVEGKDMPIFSVDVVPEGSGNALVGGATLGMVTQAGSDETRLRLDPGKYYLDVSSANCQWSISIEEER